MTIEKILTEIEDCVSVFNYDYSAYPAKIKLLCSTKEHLVIRDTETQKVYQLSLQEVEYTNV